MGVNGGNGQWIESYARWVIRWRWLVVAATLALFGLVASGAPNVYFNGDYRVFFSKDNPQLLAFDRIQNVYAKDDGILIVLAPRDGNVFTPEMLAVVKEVTEKAWKIPFATRVDSLANFQNTRADGDNLIVEDLVENPSALTDADIARIRETALSEPLLADSLVSRKGDITGVNVLVQLPGTSETEVRLPAGRARELAEEIRRTYPGIDVYLTGVIILNDTFNEVSQRDLGVLFPIMLAVLIAITALILRSGSATAGVVLVILLSAVSAVGAAGWLGYFFTPPSALAPIMVLGLAVCDAMHVLVDMLRHMRKGREKRDAIVASLRDNFRPILVTSATTVIGFVTMNFSDAPPLRHLGNISAMGIVAAFVYTVTFLPAFMSIVPVKARGRGSRDEVALGRLADFVMARRRALLWVGAASVLTLGACAWLNELNDQFVTLVDRSVTFRTDTEFVTRHLTGIYRIDYSLGAGSSGGISDPAYLAKLEEFTAWWRQQPEVLHVNGLSDTMKRLNRAMHDDDPSWYRLPDDRALAAQYLLLYEMSLPYGLDLNTQINVDKSATRLSVTVKDLKTAEIQEVAGRGERWLREHAPPAMFTHGVGAPVMFAHIFERNITGMLNGTALGFVLISFALIFALRSLRFGLLSLIPNVLPVIVTFGIWGLMVGQIGFSVSIVAAMSLGIVDDDTVHFMSKYIRARREHGLSPEDSVRYAFGSVGKAIIATTLVLIASFMVLSLSVWTQNADLGRLTAVTILVALLADLLVLPPIVLFMERRWKGASEPARGTAGAAAAAGTS